MLVELVTHTAHPGQLADFLRIAAEELRPLQAKAGAQLLYVTTGATGRLNECITAWSYASQAQHAQAADALAADAQWLQARTRATSALLREHVQLVRTTDFSTVTRPPQPARLIDLRTYSFRPGGLQAFLPVCEADGLPRQRVHCGHLVFHGVSVSGRLHQLVQAWAYADHDAYEAGQKALFDDEQWARGYRERVLHLVQEQEHQLLRILAGSPAA
jgi:hypothetical protein